MHDSAHLSTSKGTHVPYGRYTPASPLRRAETRPESNRCHLGPHRDARAMRFNKTNGVPTQVNVRNLGVSDQDNLRNRILPFPTARQNVPPRYLSSPPPVHLPMPNLRPKQEPARTKDKDERFSSWLEDLRFVVITTAVVAFALAVAGYFILL